MGKEQRTPPGDDLTAPPADPGACRLLWNLLTARACRAHAGLARSPPTQRASVHTPAGRLVSTRARPFGPATGRAPHFAPYARAHAEDATHVYEVARMTARTPPAAAPPTHDPAKDATRPRSRACEVPANRCDDSPPNCTVSDAEASTAAHARCCPKCCDPVHEYFCGESCCSEQSCDGFGVQLMCCCVCACYPLLICVALPSILCEGCCERCCPESSERASSHADDSMVSSGRRCSGRAMQRNLSSSASL